MAIDSLNSSAMTNAACPQIPNAPVRILASGKCTFILTAGRLKFYCPCDKGTFHLSSVDPDEKCERCEHTLNYHEDAVSSAVPQNTEQVIPDEDRNETQYGWIEDDPYICPRQDTVTELIKLIDAYPVILVRGTPASGKTTLARLLRSRLQEQGHIVPFFYTWKQDLIKLDPELWVALAKAFKQRLPRSQIPNLMNDEVVMIVDEAQGSYDDDYLWNHIIKLLIDKPRRYKLRICLFCYFGSPSTGVEPPQGLHYSPAIIPERQSITLTPQSCSESPKIGLFYTESEFDDVLCRIFRYDFPNWRVTIDDEAKKYLFFLTYEWAPRRRSGDDTTYCADMKHDRMFVITRQHVLNILDGDEEYAFAFVLRCGVSRSFTKRIDLKDPVREILCEITEKGNINWEQRPGLEECYERGWIHRMHTGPEGNSDQYEIAVLPSRLHEKWLQYLISQDKRALPPRFTNLTQLCMEILHEFSSMNLKPPTTDRRLSTAAQPRPVETQYQDEFYRAFCKVAGRGVPISTEWARTASGRADFFIPEKKWAVELVRNHDRIDDHVKRFQKGGQYFEWLQKKAVEDWIVINCATSVPNSDYEECRLFHAVFFNDFTEVQILDHKRQPLSDVVCLTK
ncbi:ATP-binding protein [Aspergillus vadensis CBS 113365]|uniref:Uncharacterized protein n=1 Tax=Aspergillus vadensis (strain CBS 113365 / IMI 142717 / IBT 24658) TaxID=1448311 RepID=A0A319BE46_ASPVC|nr:hypothetical protein BO88DRAFT_487061 [Aspergillus vadensis CBS 113365]PYH70284.1 hypothetical protein BO88DRAFT_487061 [Aspergillus vadensis CBS 113365]